MITGCMCNIPGRGEKGLSGLAPGRASPPGACQHMLHALFTKRHDGNESGAKIASNPPPAHARTRYQSSARCTITHDKWQRRRMRWEEERKLP